MAPRPLEWKGQGETTVKIIRTAEAAQTLGNPPVTTKSPQEPPEPRDALATPPPQSGQQTGGRAGDYCVGLSVNADLGWKPGSDVSFMTFGKKDTLIGAMHEAARAGHMKIVDTRVTAYGDDPDYGFTYFVVLGQSHMTLHTWPERFFFNIDVFTCGNEGDPEQILSFLKQRFRPHFFRVNRFDRGLGFDTKDVDVQPGPQHFKPV